MAEKNKRRWLTAEQFHKDPSDDVVVQKFAVGIVKADDGDDRQVRFIISTGSVDRDNDTIAVDGWELGAFRQNPVVLWAHSHRDLPVGKAVNLESSGSALEAVTEFADHPFAESVFRLVQGGFLRAASVGFRPLEWVHNEERGGIDFKKQELVEFSVVPVPANPEALVAAEAAGVDLELLRKWLADTLAAWPGELKLPGTAWEKVLEAAEEDEPEESPIISSPSPTYSLDANLLQRILDLDERLKGFEDRFASDADELPVELEANNDESKSADRLSAEEDISDPPDIAFAPSADDDAFVLTVSVPDPEPLIDFDPDDFKQACAEGLRRAFLEDIGNQADAHLRYLRGRV